VTEGADREVERMHRLYEALLRVNQAIAKSSSLEDLFQRICDALVAGPFQMAWIGWRDRTSDRVVPRASAGDTTGYLEDLVVYADDRPEGRGPSGQALREGRAIIVDDSLTDPSTRSWRDALLRAGFQACASFPIREAGQVEGVLNVYAARSGFFQERERGLLAEAASEISMGIDSLSLAEDRRRAYEAVERERRFTANVIEAMPGILYLYSAQGMFLRWNQNFERVSGFTPEEIRTMHPLDFFDDEDKARVGERIAETFDLGESRIEASLRAKDGTLTPHIFTGRRITFEGETCLVGVGVDVSRRTRVEEALRKSEERYRTTLDSILEGGQIIGHDWRYLYLNEAAARHNRRPNAELLGRTFQEMWPGIEDTYVFTLFERAMREGVPQHGEVDFVFPTGERAWFDLRIQPIPEGLFVLSIDITERKRAEAALRELNELLEHKVAERTRELDAARLQAEAADRIKSAFLATMSHELRTPLNSIIGFTGMLVQGLAGPINAEQEKQLGMVRNSSRHLLELINDVLDISKIEAGELELYRAPTDVLAIATQVIDTLRPLAEKKGLALRLVAPPTVRVIETDARRVKQVLINLVNNALKFTDRGGVTVEIREVDQSINIDVKDSGIGIAEKDLPKLFHAFRQVHDGLVRPYDGTGLGLAICRRLVDLLGGTIRVESILGEGSTFSITFPSGSS
jgi:PAS domain S-box-containing protein